MQPSNRIAWLCVAALSGFGCGESAGGAPALGGSIMDAGVGPAPQDAGSFSDASFSDASLSDASFSDASSTADAGDTADGGRSPDLEVEFFPCDLVLDQGDRSAQCANISVPLDHDDPQGERINVAIKRVLSDAQPAEHAVWLLPGGPGQPGTSSMAGYASLRQFLPAVDLYSIDHRGSGGSTRLFCPTAEAETSTSGAFVDRSEREVCAAELATWGERLRFFSRSQAARDVIAIAEALGGYERRTLRGGSYGTAWARRILQLRPDVFDDAIMTAVAGPTTDLGGPLDETMNAVGRRFMALCGEEPTCADRFGPDPVARIEALHARMRNGHCAELMSSELLRVVSGEFLSTPILRSLLVPMFVRIDRCNPNDRNAIGSMLDQLFGDGGGGGLDWPLFFHVSASELIDPTGPSAADAIAALEGYQFATGRGADVAWMREGWPTYVDPDAGGAWSFSGPVLWLHGDLDPLLPVADVQAQASMDLQGPLQRLVLFAGAGHSLVGGTPANGGGDCAVTYEIDFLREPAAPPHPCVNDLVPPRFAPPPNLSLQLFGDFDPWGDP